jgi:hypothetical protein
MTTVNCCKGTDTLMEKMTYCARTHMGLWADG